MRLRWWDWEESAPKTSVMLRLEHEQPSSSNQESEHQQSSRPQRTRQVPQRLRDFEMWPDNAITADGDLLHLALLCEVEPVTFEVAIRMKGG